MRSSLRLFVIAAAAALAVTAVPATTLDPVGLRDMVGNADLVFMGVVRDVAYRTSDVDAPGQIALPHTFVTFDIERVLKGRSTDGQQITLRFQGGPDGLGNIMIVQGVPLFDIGDRDIVFVRGNGAQLAPIVGWEQGRLRVVDGEVFGDGGEEIWLDGRNEIVRGPVHALPEAASHSIGGNLVEFEVKSSPARWSPPQGARRPDALAFTLAVGKLVAQLHSADALAKLQPAQSANVGDRLHVAMPAAGAPPKDAAPSAAQTIEQSAADDRD